MPNPFRIARCSVLAACAASFPAYPATFPAHPPSTGSRAAPEADAQAPGLRQQNLSPVAMLLMGIVKGTPAGPAALQRLTAGNRNPAPMLEAACQEITALAPVMLDTNTRLDGCRGGAGKRVAFHLNLVNFDGAREGTEAFMKSARPVLVRGVCRNPDVVMLGRSGVTLVFRYTGIGQRAVGDLTVEPGACNASQGP